MAKRENRCDEQRKIEDRNRFHGLSPCCVQMLWWGMDEMLAELFACHPNSSGFKGNLPGQFWAEIEGKRFGTNQTVTKIGVFGGRYMIVFLPSESVES